LIRIDFSARHLALVAAMLITAALIYLLRDVVLLLGVAFMLTVALQPLVALTESKGISHALSVAVVMAGLVVLPLALLAVLSPLVIGEVQSLTRGMPSVQAHVEVLLRQFGLASFVNNAVSRANPQERLGSLALVSAQLSASLLVGVVTVVVITGYLLVDGPQIKRILHYFVPEISERHIEPLLDGVERVVGGYFRGQILTSVLFGVYAFVLCLVLGVPSPLLLGIVAAIGDVIPLFGIPVAMLVAVLVAFTHSVWQSIAVLVGYLIYNQLESHVIVPRIYSRTVNLPPLLVILATIAGGALNGIVGILVAIPIVAVLKVIFDYVVAERLRSQAEATEPASPEANDPFASKATDEALGWPLQAGAAQVAGDGIPAPSVSPFESVTENDFEVRQKAELAEAVSIRILRLEEAIAGLTELVAKGPETANGAHPAGRIGP
jgi:predicted PurR-regulated permease PerM